MMMDVVEKWDRRFLRMAELVASWSKDPSTKAGAVIVRPDRTVASVGYNGFPRGIDDSPFRYADRESKYSRIIHAEVNAVLSARERLEGYTIYVHPFMTCDRCSVQLIQAGIKRVVTPVCPEHLQERWAESFERARSYYAEAFIGFTEYAQEVH